jgi:thiamine-phosphate pyrophosphorylase
MPFVAMLPLPLPPSKPSKPVICWVTDSRTLAEGDPSVTRDALLNVICEAAAAGVDWVQIREKHLSARELMGLAREAIAIAGPARVIINDRLDIALAAGAAGIHLGGESLPVESVADWRRAARQTTGGTTGRPTDQTPRPTADRTTSPVALIAADFLIGRSCHHLEEIHAAEIAGADYVFFGPVFSTPSKERYGPPQGLQKLAEACRSTHLPVLAIGGITAENASESLRAGAAGIAAIRLFQRHSADLRALIQLVRQAK